MLLWNGNIHLIGIGQKLEENLELILLLLLRVPVKNWAATKGDTPRIKTGPKQGGNNPKEENNLVRVRETDSSESHTQFKKNFQPNA